MNRSIEVKCAQDKSRLDKKENKVDQSMVKDSDGNGDSIPDSPWGTPLLGDGDWKSFVSMGKEI